MTEYKPLSIAKGMSPEAATRTMASISKRFTRLHRHVKDVRRPHYFNDSAVDPELAEPLAHVKYQSDIIRKTLVDIKGRMQENHGVAHVNPRHQTSESAEADAVEAALNAMWAIIEERNGSILQADMVDGQGIDGYSVLHWYRMDQAWPEVPEYEWLDTLPEDDEYDSERTKRQKSRTRARFEKEPRENGKYRETDDSLQKRTELKRATAGSPYHAEVVDFFSVFFARDQLYDTGPVMMVKRLPLIDYNEELGAYGKEVGIERTKAVLRDMRDALESTPGAAPPKDSPSGPDFGETITVATLWTRSEWYEFCSYSEFTLENFDMSGWTFVKSGKHGFGRPPFEIVTADLFNSNEPLERYQPAMEGLFRQKPNHDRLTAIFMGLAERVALPDMWFESQPGAEPALTDAGDDVTIGTDSSNAGKLPEGYRLQQSNMQMNPAFPMARDQMQADLENARPSVGTADIGRSTQPWTAKIDLEQANVQPRMYMGSQLRALRAMWRSICRDISTPAEDGGFGEPVVVYARRKEDGQETDRIVGIDPEDVETLNIEVSIDPTSSAEKTTNVEHGASLLQRGLITRRSFYEDYMGIPNASDYLADLDAERLVEQYLKPGILAQVLAEEFGAKAVFTPDGKLVGFNGQEADPNQMMASQGYAPQVPPGIPNPAGPAGNPTQPPLVDTPLPGRTPRIPIQA